MSRLDDVLTVIFHDNHLHTILYITYKLFLFPDTVFLVSIFSAAILILDQGESSSASRGNIIESMKVRQTHLFPHRFGSWHENRGTLDSTTQFIRSTNRYKLQTKIGSTGRTVQFPGTWHYYQLRYQLR